MTPGNPSDLRGEVERIARNMGATKRMGFVEFQMLVSRFPQIFQPAEILYRLMSVNSVRLKRCATCRIPIDLSIAQSHNALYVTSFVSVE